MKRKAVFVILFFFFFIGAFSTYYFADDFYFLKASTISTLPALLNVFSPFKNTFYHAALSTLFYFFLHFSGIFVGRVVVFVLFLTGIYFLYKILAQLLSRTTALFAVFLYAFSFTHVFQLYWFATIQEVMLMTALAISFYAFINKKYALTLLSFIFALFCKEQAALYPVFLLLYVFLFPGPKTKRSGYSVIVASFVMTALVMPLYVIAMRTTVALPEYRFHFSPRLIFNNTVWYTLWSLGFPSMLPDYVSSLIRPPLPQFYRYFGNPVFSAYFFLMIAFLIVFMCTAIYLYVIQKRRINGKALLFLIAGFILFAAPTLPIIHKWMVRLTIPLIFVSIAEASVIAALFNNKSGKVLAYAILAIYFVFNFLGVKVHEDASTYRLESGITKNAALIFAGQRSVIEKEKKVIITDDSGTGMSSWAGVEKLKVTFAGQNASAFYFPGKNIPFVYIGKDETATPGGHVIPASLFFRQR